MDAYPRYDDTSLTKRGEARAEALPRRLGVSPDTLRGARVLEIGCGFGEATAAVAARYGAEAIGIDPNPRWRQRAFAGLEQDGVLRLGDACSPDVLELGTFDFAHSYTVFEHIPDPLAAMANMRRLIKPGGRAYLSYNLYRGASASHLMRYLEQPWVHLTHSTAEIEAMMMAKRGQRRGPAWVNKLTCAHYLYYWDQFGFDIRSQWYDKYTMPDDLYKKYESVFAAYPRDELEKNFMHVSLIRRADA